MHIIFLCNHRNEKNHDQELFLKTVRNQILRSIIRLGILVARKLCMTFEPSTDNLLHRTDSSAVS